MRTVVISLTLTTLCACAPQKLTKDLPVGSASVADCAVTYSVTDLGVLPGGLGSEGRAISAGGQVAGASGVRASNGPTHAFLWTAAAGLQDIGTLGGAFSVGAAVNDNGCVAGSSQLADDFTQHAFFYFAPLGIEDIGTLGGNGPDASTAAGMNPSNQVVGSSRLANGFLHAFTWLPGGTMTDLGTIVGTPTSNSGANAIDHVGRVVGWSDTASGLTHAALWSFDAPVDLAPTSTASVAYAINDDNPSEIVGVVDGVPALFANGAVSQLPLNGFQSGAALGIDTSHTIVGYVHSQSGEVTTERAMVWQAGVGTDLNTLIPAGSGWILSRANAINVNGQITGVGVIGGQAHAFVATPSAPCQSPQFIAATTVANGTVAARPDGVDAGDVLVAALEVDTDPAGIVAPPGWTQVIDQGGGFDGEVHPGATFHALAYTHVATADEPDSYLFGAPDGAYVDLQILAFSGVSAVDRAAGGATSGTTIAAPNLFTSQPNELLLTFFVNFAYSTWDAPAGFTKLTDFDANSVSMKVLPSAGATGPAAATASAPGDLIAISVALKP